MRFRCEVFVLGKWVVTSHGWSVVERDAALQKGLDPHVRFVPEVG